MFVTGDRAEDHPKVYTRIHVEHVLRGRGLQESSVQRAIELSVEKYCSALAMLSKSASITTSHRIIEEGKEEVNH